ncbi:MAG TPA: hypothetical protein VK671_07970, partial [Mucilaginibacter sp.]|nr:hypothetical protein [Mucilaginibacter sp.]
MEEMELKSIWNAYDKKLEQSLKLNMKLFENMQKGKAKSKLTALLSIKVSGLIVGILWNLLLGTLIYGNHFRNIYFCISLGFLVLFGIIAIAAYIKHMVLISQVDYSESITDAQQKLAELQVSTVRTTGFLWLQMPFYTTFFWNQDWISNGGNSFWLIAVPITLLFTIAAIWLFRNISPENL